MRRPRRYRDRVEAGQMLAAAVAERVAGSSAIAAIVLALPRGGVPVAAPVAHLLGAALDVLTVRKIGAPHHEELAIGAIASGGIVLLNDEVIAHLGVGPDAVEHRTAVARRELADQERRFRGGRDRPVLTGRTVIVVDDGLATGATMRVAVRAARQGAPQRIVVAVPVGPPDTCADLATVADEVVCPVRPPGFTAVGEWYADFRATTDADVLRLLEEASDRPPTR